jgi:hypothetical protein
MNQDERRADGVLKTWQDRIKLSKSLNLEGVVRYDIETAEAVMALARAGIVEQAKRRLPSRWTVFWVGLWVGIGAETLLR